MPKDRWHELSKLVQQDDGLPTWEDAGLWTEQKLRYWCRYLDTTTNAMVGHPRWPGGVVYVDLFAGPGVCVLKDSKKRRIPGSVLIAANMSKPFARIIACEARPESAEACRARLDKTLVASRCHVLNGDCNDRIAEIVALIPNAALTLAFVDPTGLDAQFTTVQTLSQGRNVDLVILFADAYDIPRNLEQYYRGDPNSRLDQVLGPNSRWRERLSESRNPTGSKQRRLFRQVYQDQLQQRLGYAHFRHKPIRSSRGPIYSLVYASKHELGLRFWDAALGKDRHGQRDLPFGSGERGNDWS